MDEKQELVDGIVYDVNYVKLDAYRNLILSYREYTKATLGLGNRDHTFRKLKSNLLTYYLTVMGSYSKRNKKTYKSEITEDIVKTQNQVEVKSCAYDLILWSQLDGPFKVTREKESIENGW